MIREAFPLASILHRKDTDMTEGSIPRLLITFAIPLLIGNLFQQLYNTVDSIVVGNFVGKSALAAVGCTGPVINAFVSVFIGLSTGSTVVIAQYFGAKDRDRLSQAVHTTILVTLVTCVILTAAGVLATPLMLRLMQTPEDVLPQAAEYLRIFFWGITGVHLYNSCAGILRAVGDSTRPLYLLIFCTMTNTVLDVLFTGILGMGIAGAAWATVISQFLSAILVLRLLLRTDAAYRVELKQLRFDLPILGKILLIGIPSALQMGITSLSNVFVQSYVNRFASTVLAGWTAYNRVDSFAMLPMMSLSTSITTFVGQNLGAGKRDRAKAAVRQGLVMGLLTMTVLLTPLMLFAPQLTRLFNGDSEVVRYGSWFIRVISPFYLPFAVNQVYLGALRGAGDTRSSMVICLSSYVVFRQIYLFVSYRMGGGLLAVALGYPAGWVLCMVLLLLYYYLNKNVMQAAAVGDRVKE